MQPMARAQLDEGVARAQFASLLNRFQGFSKVADKEQTVGISAQASATESSDREVCQSGLLIGVGTILLISALVVMGQPRSPVASEAGAGHVPSLLSGLLSPPPGKASPPSPLMPPPIPTPTPNAERPTDTPTGSAPKVFPLSCQNGWQPYGQGYQEPQVSLVGGIVHLRGLIKGGDAQHLATLIEAHRPPKGMVFTTMARYDDSTIGEYRVDIYANGLVTGFSASGRTNIPLWVSFDGLSFPLRATPQPLSCLNGWRPFGQGYQEPQVSLVSGVVYLQGLVKGGHAAWATHLATLAQGYRPSLRLVFTTMARYNQNKMGEYRIDIGVDGEVTGSSAAGEQDQSYMQDRFPLWVSLDGLSFPL